MARADREIRIQRLSPYRWKPGQSGNRKGRPKKEHELRWYIEGAMLNMPIPPEFYRNAMVICGMQKQLEQLDALILSGAKLEDARLCKIIPPVIRTLNYGQYGAMRAAFEAAKNPDLFIKIVDQVHGKPTRTANYDESLIRSAPQSDMLVVTVTEEETDESD